ncbi:hypothetical protein ABO04_00145 [Nitrosomonas sp. HPC101]|nr:hypothetical protein [Nitrosomonas sp. HPC101]
MKSCFEIIHIFSDKILFTQKNSAPNATQTVINFTVWVSFQSEEYASDTTLYFLHFDADIIAIDCISREHQS